MGHSNLQLLSLFGLAFYIYLGRTAGIVPRAVQTRSVNSGSTNNHNITCESLGSCPQLRGRDGRDGLPGPPGVPGRDGQKGDHGLYGRDGRDGQPGPPGRVGQKGDQGLRGFPGRVGQKGDQGLRGFPGRVGQKGDQGLRGLPGRPATRNAGVVYTRWGKRTCPTGTALVYSGRVGGSFCCGHGGAANYLCMPDNPDYGTYTLGVQGWGQVYGTEYQTHSSPLSAVHDHNAPCAVCHASTRTIVLMIPAKNQCPSSWTLEYSGYLMSATSKSGHQDHRTMFECVDRNPDSVPGSAADTAAAVFYPVEANCNGMACPPYDPQKELTCAVCTK